MIKWAIWMEPTQRYDGYPKQGRRKSQMSNENNWIGVKKFWTPIYSIRSFVSERNNMILPNNRNAKNNTDRRKLVVCDFEDVAVIPSGKMRELRFLSIEDNRVFFSHFATIWQRGMISCSKFILLANCWVRYLNSEMSNVMKSGVIGIRVNK